MNEASAPRLVEHLFRHEHGRIVAALARALGHAHLDLAEEAIRLTRLLVVNPSGDRPSAHALLALLLFQSSRLPARLDQGGAMVPIAEQSRARWARYSFLPAARAHFLTKLGRVEEAAVEYARAADLADNEADRAYLRRRSGRRIA